MTSLQKKEKYIKRLYPENGYSLFLKDGILRICRKFPCNVQQPAHRESVTQDPFSKEGYLLCFRSLSIKIISTCSQSSPSGTVRQAVKTDACMPDDFSMKRNDAGRYDPNESAFFTA